MTRASEYAAKLKRLLPALRRKYGKPPAVEPTEPIEQLVMAILARDTTDTRARKGLASVRDATVDFNDLRVTTTADIVEALGSGYPDALSRARDIRAALNDIFDRENALDLAFLHQRARRDTRKYLESLRGVDAFTSASLLLWSFGGHAIPLDEPMLVFLRRQDVVHPDAPMSDVRAFVERHITAAAAKPFTILVRQASSTLADSAARRKQAAAKSAAKAASKTGQAERAAKAKVSTARKKKKSSATAKRRASEKASPRRASTKAKTASRAKKAARKKPAGR